MARMTLFLFLIVSLPAHAQGISAQMDERDPVVAATVVLTTAYALERIQSYCGRNHPATLTAVKEARSAWFERHRSLYSRANSIFETLLSAGERDRLWANIEAENRQIETVLSGATSEQSNEWCIQTTRSFDQPELNPISNSLLVQTLVNYSQ